MRVIFFSNAVSVAHLLQDLVSWKSTPVCCYFPPNLFLSSNFCNKYCHLPGQCEFSHTGKPAGSCKGCATGLKLQPTSSSDCPHKNSAREAQTKQQHRRIHSTDPSSEQKWQSCPKQGKETKMKKEIQKIFFQVDVLSLPKIGSNRSCWGTRMYKELRCKNK